MFDDCVTKKARELGIETYGVFVRAKRAYGSDTVNVAADHKKWCDHGIRPEYVDLFLGRRTHATA